MVQGLSNIDSVIFTGDAPATIGENNASVTIPIAASRPALYAGAGIWYDAIDELSRLIAAQPENRELRIQRAALLEQVGLTEAAAFDRAALR